MSYKGLDFQCLGCKSFIGEYYIGLNIKPAYDYTAGEYGVSVMYITKEKLESLLEENTKTKLWINAFGNQKRRNFLY